MARIRWPGCEFDAEPIRQRDDGTWEMKATAHSARFSPGTIILVKATEIVEMAAAEMPLPPDQGLAALQAAMDEERKSLPNVAELLAKAAPTPGRPL